MGEQILNSFSSCSDSFGNECQRVRLYFWPDFLGTYDGITFWGTTHRTGKLHTIAHLPIRIWSKFMQYTHKIGKLDFNEIIRIEKRN